MKTDHGFHHKQTGALLCPADLDWDDTESVLSHCLIRTRSDVPRTKEKLRSGKIVVSGDQLPVFLYQESHYDLEDLWNGLFRSSLLVSVSTSHSLSDGRY